MQALTPGAPHGHPCRGGCAGCLDGACGDIERWGEIELHHIHLLPVYCREAFHHRCVGERNDNVSIPATRRALQPFIFSISVGTRLLLKLSGTLHETCARVKHTYSYCLLVTYSSTKLFCSAVLLVMRTRAALPWRNTCVCPYVLLRTLHAVTHCISLGNVLQSVEYSLNSTATGTVEGIRNPQK